LTSVLRVKVSISSQDLEIYEIKRGALAFLSKSLATITPKRPNYFYSAKSMHYSALKTCCFIYVQMRPTSAHYLLNKKLTMLTF